MCENGDGGRQELVAVRYRLPGSLTGSAPPAVWMSGGVVSLPRAVKPAQLVQERFLYRTLVTELRGGLAIDLEPSPDFDRGIGDASGPVVSGGGGGERYLIVGSSNARRLHEALTEAGKVSELIYLDQLRIIRSTGELIKAKIGEAVAKEKPTAIVIQILDNSLFEVITEEGERLPPQKVEGRTHFAGDIAVADRAVLRKLLMLCRPALDATEGIKTAFIGPLPRYVMGACCDEMGHMANRTEPGFFQRMKQDLAVLNKEIKDFLFNDDYQNVRAMDPWVGLKNLGPDMVWGEDPVHIKRELMKHLVEGVQITLDKITPKRRRDSVESSGSKRARGGGRGGGGGGRGPGTAARGRGHRGGH
jgi:hypothetical protein